MVNMYVVYILESTRNGRHYVGMTSDLEDRLRRHNTGNNRSTKSGAPWKVVHVEMYPNKAEAWSREQKIKSYKGGEAFKKLLS